MNMGPDSQVHPIDFPAHLDPTEIETRCARESFTWGPQALWLLCGLLWFFYFVVRDVPQVARNTALIGLGVTVLAALGVRSDLRRRKRRIALYPRGEQIGLYSGNVFQYSFTPAEMIWVQLDFFARAMTVLKALLPMLLVAATAAVLVWFSLKESGPHAWQDSAILAYCMLFAIFGFTAIFRSRLILAFFWLPNGEGKSDKAAHFHPRELKKLKGGMGTRWDEAAWL